jgi:parvulin-like peptidyl-prolyl isomerase
MATDPNNTFFDFSQANNRRSFALLGLGAVLGLAIAGYGLFTASGTVTNTVPPEYVAIVNKRPVYRSDYIIQLQNTYQVTYAEATPEQRKKVLEDMIDEELLVQRGLEMDLPSYDPDVRNALVAGVELEMYADVLASQPSDEELRAYYEKHRDQYSSLAVLKLRDLVLNVESGETADATKQRAQDAIAALRAGKPIDDVMQKYKLRDSLHLQQGGKADLGEIFEFAAEANLPPAVFKVLKTLKAGDVSEPIDVSGEGQHILVVTMLREAHAQGFDDVRSRVWTDIKNEQQNKVRNSTLKFLRSKSEILTAKE